MDDHSVTRHAQERLQHAVRDPALATVLPIRLRRDGSRRDNSRRTLIPSLGVHDMAIDLGTANTLVYVGGRGIVVSEPSVVASDLGTGEVHAVGAEAERMIGRTPATISATRPLRHGVIADFEVTEEMLRYFIRKVIDRRTAHPRLIVCAPSGVTEVEKRAVEEASLAAGARQVHLIEEPIAAAIGAGLPIEEPVGRLVVDVGGGTSEMAVISLGGIVVFRSVRVGGYEMDEAIAHYIRNVYQLVIGSRTAERIKIEIGSALPLAQELTYEVRGRHLVSGLPTAVTLHSEEIREAMAPPLREIMQAIRDTLEQTPPELSADISRDGILLAGGGTLVRGFDEMVAADTGMPVFQAESPLTCVAVGSGEALAHIDALNLAGRQLGRTPPTPDWRTAQG
jgi:rod shape-determining protein MreB and related proteins